MGIYKKKKKTKVQMSGGICDFIPDDPSCVTPDPEPVPEPEPEVVDPVIDGGDAGKDEAEAEAEEAMEKGDMHMEHDKGHDKEKGDMSWEEFDEKAAEYMDPMAGNLAYLSVAAGALFHAVTH